MGAASSHPATPGPVIDFRLFYELLTSKSSNAYTISPSFTSSTDPSPGYRALMHTQNKRSAAPDIDVFKADGEAKDGLGDSIGVIRSNKETFEFALGDNEEYEKILISMLLKKKRFEFGFSPSPSKSANQVAKIGRVIYFWQITRRSPMGNIKEIILRVKPDVDPEEGEEITEEKGGEIVAVWRKKGWLRGGEGHLFIKSSWGKKIGGGKEWEEAVVVSTLGMLEGSGRA